MDSVHGKRDCISVFPTTEILWFQLTQKKAEKEEKILHNLKEMENKQFMQYKEEEEEEEYWSHPEVSTGRI
jgi:hypothetical protein